MIYWLPGILLAVDRLTKILSLNLKLPFYPNKQLFFFSAPLPLLIILSCLLLFVLLFVALTVSKPLLKTALLLIILGGFSNLYDRLVFGFTIDWFTLPLWPISVLNLSDLMIVAGGLLLFF